MSSEQRNDSIQYKTTRLSEKIAEGTGTVVLGRHLAEAVGRALHVHDQLAP
jgi:hypothetical protein